MNWLLFSVSVALLVLDSCHCRHVAVEQLIYFQNAQGEITEHNFVLDFSEVADWPRHVRNFEEAHGYPVNGLRNLVYDQLVEYAYPVEVLEVEQDVSENVSTGQSDAILVHMAVKALYRSQEPHRTDNTVYDSSYSTPHSNDDRLIVFPGEKNAFQNADPIRNSQWLWQLQQYHDKSSSTHSDPVFASYSADVAPSVVPFFIRSRAKFIIYQSLGADTGGTIALALLHKQLKQLGYESYLCDEDNLNLAACKTPSIDHIVITGEWCEGVLAEHGPGPAGFRGRAVQYHLGFHHFSDVCHGHVTTADSHQLKATLSSRIISGYFLGCPMVDSIRVLYTYLLHSNESTAFVVRDPTEKHVPPLEYLISLKKENLIVLDMDVLHDYPPHSHDISFTIPDGYQLLQLRNFPRHRMASILLRAKIVIDLAMPGPERLAGEGILLGAIPIVSKQWNGASGVDFPGIRKVDSLNNTEISEVLADVAARYPQELQSSGNAFFQGYIASMWQRLHHTADLYMGSSALHFVLTARSLEDELQVTFQVVGLLYLYPLASIDIYVRDDMWFTRHHYLFMTMMKESGYVRHDRYDPLTYSSYAQRDKGEDVERSFVRVKTFKALKRELVTASSTSPDTKTTHSKFNSHDESHYDGTVRKLLLSTAETAGIVVFLPRKVVPLDSRVLYQVINDAFGSMGMGNPQGNNCNDISTEDEAINCSMTEASHVLLCDNIPSQHKANSPKLCGALIHPESSIESFTQIYDLIWTKNHKEHLHNTTKSKGQLGWGEVKHKHQWRNVCELFTRSTSGQFTGPSSFHRHFVDYVTNTVLWQRLVKLSLDINLADNICSRL